MEAAITLNCSHYSKNLVEVIKTFQQIGWNIYNPQGKVEYLPIGDKDDYDWQCEEISEKRLYDIISEKAAQNEMAGVNLFYHNGTEGVSFLAYVTDEILLSINTNRRTVYGRHTDMAWYVEKIVYKLFEAGVSLISYELNEYDD